jgi:acetyl-CoA C-acetyltransferase
MRPKLYIAAYHQSRFGKLLELGVPEILSRAARETLAEVGADPALVDVAAVGAVGNISLNDQGLLAGLVAMVPGLAGKPIAAVENACASGGQALLTVAHQLLIGDGELGLALGFEKMRDDQGRMDGERIGRALSPFTHPQDRPGKSPVVPHLFAEVMALYMRTWGVTERDLAAITCQEYRNGNDNPYAQMQAVQLSLEQALAVSERNRYIVPGLPLKTSDCSQVTDGYAGLLLATETGLDRLGLAKGDCVELAGYAQATDPLQLAGRDLLHPDGAYRAMARAYAMAGLTAADVNVAEIHDCFTVMAAIGTEVLGKAAPGRGAAYWVDGHAAPRGECGINTSGGLIAKGHPIGATGLAMIGWCAWQLLGKVPAPLQVPNPRAAATFNIGGPICASVCTLLKA